MDFLASLPVGQQVGVALTAAIICNVIYKTIYNIFFHPLASFPGPLARRVTRLPWTISMLRYRLVHDIERLHREYGPVVRTAPDELAFLDPHAWRDIMGGGQSDIPKWSGLYGIPKFFPSHVQNTTSKEHHRLLRKALAPGFSDSSIRAQEPMMQQYITKLICRLREMTSSNSSSSDQRTATKGGGAVVDIELWYRLVVFDIICDQALGESFDCLGGDGTVHPWLEGIEKAGGAMAALIAVNMYPAVAGVLDFFINRLARAAAAVHANQVKPALERRLEKGDGRPDLLDPLIRLQNKVKSSHGKEQDGGDGGGVGGGGTDNNNNNNNNKDEILDDLLVNAQVIIGAGAETTATTLAAATSLLLENPAALERLQREVRGAFASEDEITAETVGSKKLLLPWMHACLDETMRLFPSTGAASLRLTDRVTTICGKVVPKDTVVGIWTWALYRAPSLWTDPEEFHPERWLEDEADQDPRYAGDARDTFKPFFTGSRDCIGQGLAMMEMRLILARMIYNFDMELPEDEALAVNWARKQKNGYFVWVKTALPIRLIPVERK